MRNLFFFLMMLLPLILSANEVETEDALFEVVPTEIYKNFARGYIKSQIQFQSDQRLPLRIPEQIPYQDPDLGEIQVTVTSIGSTAFGFDYLEKVILPSTLEKIEDVAFLYSGLYSITLPENLYWIGDSAFAYTHIKEIIIPESVYHIGSNAFSHSGLEYIEIKGDLKSLPHRTFNNCPCLKTIVMHSITPPKAEDSDFGLYECILEHGPAPMCGDGGIQEKHNVDVENCIVYVPDESIADYEEASGWCNFAKYGNIKGLSTFTLSGTGSTE